ncbi:MAG TPA: DUF917 domain-containing protein [Pseudonocardia sp.]|nr:DUF917 domain-containing protein [Pseudonocardia sp.]
MSGERLGAADVDAFIVGLTLLGSGGGGEADAYRHLLSAALSEGPIELGDPAEFGDAPVVAIGMLGGTRMLTEKLPSGQEIPRALAALTRWTGVEPAALMPLEAAGLNGTLVAASAAQLGLPLLDADLMGRALPRMDQLSRAVSGGPITPFAMSEPTGQTLLIDAATPYAVEHIARSFVAHSGGWAGTASAPMPASEVPRDACLGSLGRALRLGRAHRELPGKPPPELVAAALGGELLGVGRAADISRQASTPFGRASITVLGGIAGRGPVLRLEAENEYLLVLRDGVPVASCPDLICVLDRRTATPIAVDSLRPGDDLVVLVLPGPPWWRASPERLRHVDPRAFGLGCDAVLLPAQAGDRAGTAPGVPA